MPCRQWISTLAQPGQRRPSGFAYLTEGNRRVRPKAHVAALAGRVAVPQNPGSSDSARPQQQGNVGADPDAPCPAVTSRGVPRRAGVELLHRHRSHCACLTTTTTATTEWRGLGWQRLTQPAMAIAVKL